jgi:hypothetical protein
MEELATEANSKDLWFYLLQIWSSIVVGVIVYLGGVSAKRVVHIWVPRDTPEPRQPTWFRLWAATLDWHPVAVGGLLGLVPWPSPDFLHHWWVRVLWFAGVGAVCGQIYRAVKTALDGLPALVRQILRAVIEWVRSKMGLAPAPADPKADSDPPPASDSADAEGKP